MSEYRIIKKSMVDVIGRAYFKFEGVDYCDVYAVQYKNWRGKWKDVKGASTCITLNQAQKCLELAKKGLLSDKGYEVVE